MRVAVILILACLRLSGQTDPENAAFFINHLSRQERHEEAIRMLRFEQNAFSADSFQFLLGREYHHLQMIDSAASCFSRVNKNSGLYAGSRIIMSLGKLYRNQLKEAGTILDDRSVDSHAELRKLMRAAAALLGREFDVFDSLAAGFSYDHYSVSSEQRSLVSLRSRLGETKKKSPAAAAVLSAVVPGLGKFYAGRKGAGLATLLANTILAGMAAETLYRGGAESPQFIGAAVVFGVFYAGNIVGSHYSVRQQQRTETGKINNEILATVHLPVHRLFLQ